MMLGVAIRRYVRATASAAVMPRARPVFELMTAPQNSLQLRLDSLAGTSTLPQCACTIRRISRLG